MTPEKKAAAIRWLTDEIRSLRMASAINGCGPENWAEQLEVMETCLEAVKKCDRNATEMRPGCNTPLTLEQLRGLDGKPVWVQVIDHTVFADKEDDFGGWGMCRKSWARVWDGKRADLVHIDYDFEDYGQTWIAYAYPPAHIDREAWKECTYCSGIPHMEGVELKPCASGNIGCEVTFGKCRDDESVGMVVYHRNTAGGYVDFDFCPFCGKPQTEEPWAILEKRLRG